MQGFDALPIISATKRATGQERIAVIGRKAVPIISATKHGQTIKEIELGVVPIISATQLVTNLR